MGVPRLAPWVWHTFKHVSGLWKKFQQGEMRFVIDHFYLDGNGPLHSICQKIFNYGPNKRISDPYVTLSFKEKITLVFEHYFNYILQLTEMVTPQKTIYIAIDGPAPLAKQAQQRQRRAVSARDRREKEAAMSESEKAEMVTFDSASISPGTLFEFELTKYLNYRIRKEIESGAWRNLTVYFSPPTVPGEGEHSCLEHMRTWPQKNKDNDSFCMFGPDGDLIMLTLSVHIPNMFLFRENLEQPGFFDLINMGMVRKELRYAIGLNQGNASNDNVIDDFILTGMFVGNDFVPKIQMFVYLERGLELMFQEYSYISHGGKVNTLTYIKNGKSYINKKAFTNFVDHIAKWEVEFITKQITEPLPLKDDGKPDEKFKDITLLEASYEVSLPNGKSGVALHWDKYREAYYKRAGVTDVTDVKEMCSTFLKTMAWAFDYYTNGLPSWTWFYPYHYAPLMHDLAEYMKTSSTSADFEFEMGQPSLPFVQLLTILSPPSAALLPEPLSNLLTDPNSPLVQAGYYPEKFKIDYEGKKKEHLGVALLPFVDVNLVRKVYEERKLEKRYARNTFGKTGIFKYMGKNHYVKYISDYGTFETHVRKFLLE